jgi:hypothetical protein
MIDRGMKGVWMVAKEAKTAEPKSHHYVPRFYLRGFTGEKGKLFAANRPTRHSFRPPPEGVAAENYFNRIDLEGMDKNELEKVLAEFEGEMGPALERVKEAKSLAEEEDRAHIMNFMAPSAKSTISWLGFISPRNSELKPRSIMQLPPACSRGALPQVNDGRIS